MPTHKILLIEDEQAYGELVIQYLNSQDFQVDHATNGLHALQLLKDNKYQAIILDLTLPDMDGLDICKNIRTNHGIPILILSARDDIADKITGFDNGANDYVVKPTSLKELSLRLKNLIKRTPNSAFRSATFLLNQLEFNTKKLTIKNHTNKETEQLTIKEASTLEYLCLNHNQILTRSEIIDHVWGNSIDPMTNTVNVVINNLRNKLTKIKLGEYIQTIHGIGIKFSSHPQSHE